MSQEPAPALSTLSLSPESPPPSAPTPTPAVSPQQLEVDSRTIMISNIPSTATEQTMKDFIISMSVPFVSFQLITNQKLSRKFAFVTYESESKADSAINDMNCVEMGYNEIRIKKKSDGVVGEKENNIYIKGISPKLRARHFFDVLGMFGKVLSVKIPSLDAKEPGAPPMRMDYGFVQFQARQAAEDAIEYLNKKGILGVEVKASKYKGIEERHEPATKGFVLKFPAAFSEELLREALAGVAVEKLEYKACKPGKTFTVAFVTLGEGSAGADLYNAVNALNEGRRELGRVKCEALLPKMKLIQRRRQEARDTWLLMKKRNVFVKGLPRDWGEGQLRALCEKHGEVDSVFLTGSTRDAANEKNAGYGFVSFKEEAQAAAAIEHLNGMFLNSCILEASQALGPHERRQKRRFEGDFKKDYRDYKDFKGKRDFHPTKMQFGHFHSNNAMEIMIDKVSEGEERRESRGVVQELGKKIQGIFGGAEEEALETARSVVKECGDWKIKEVMGSDEVLRKECEKVFGRGK